VIVIPVVALLVALIPRLHDEEMVPLLVMVALVEFAKDTAELLVQPPVVSTVAPDLMITVCPDKLLAVLIVLLLALVSVTPSSMVSVRLSLV